MRPLFPNLVPEPLKLFSTNPPNLVSLEQSHHKPRKVYDNGHLKLALGEK